MGQPSAKTRTTRIRTVRNGTEAKARATQGQTGPPRQPKAVVGQKGNDRSYSRNQEDLRSVVKALGRLVMRQEDSLSVLSLDMELVVFMRNRDPKLSPDQDLSVTQQLLTVGNHWRQVKEKDPNSLNQPLRTVLLSSWLTAIKLRVQEIQTNPAAKERAAASGILENEMIVCLQWDPQESKHVKANQEPMPLTDCLQVLDQLQALIVHPNVVGRFHPLRKLAPR